MLSGLNGTAIPTPSVGESSPANSAALGPSRSRWRVDLGGRVQGVGFRPFVWRLARQLDLVGSVGNSTRGALVEVEGREEDLQRFLDRLENTLPPLARITQRATTEIPRRFEREFRIVPSTHGGRRNAEITPDVATCNNCLIELFDPSNRRFHHAFINCTDCGPRYSIIRGVPYDRGRTTMSVFRMCPNCRDEYEDPADRRFHAQPNACPKCGPRLWLTGADGTAVENSPIAECARLLRTGAIVAIKGIGGFHLTCRADHDTAVSRLRERKGRDAKPMALMAPSLPVAHTLVEIDDVGASELTGDQRPIVLLPRKRDAETSRHVAPRNPSLAVMLPYSPIHHLLFAEGLSSLVVTSANTSDEPLCHDNDEAQRRLANIADAFLLHDRTIERRIDDSVVRVVGRCSAAPDSVSRTIPVRSGRGDAPYSTEVSQRSPVPILAVGGDMKSAACLHADRRAILSEHLGDLSNPATYRNFTRTVERLQELHHIEPAVVAHDLHPEYASTRFAQGLGVQPIAVQHHHAHIVSGMADNALEGRVVGVACDGTGYGTDGAIWGCELMVCDASHFERVAHLRYFPLLGADNAAQDTWRPAIGLIFDAFGLDFLRRDRDTFKTLPPTLLALAHRRLEHPRRITQTSSLGRLFDAVAFLLGICDVNKYEGQAAAALEDLALESPPVDPLPYAVSRSNHDDDAAPIQLDVRPMIRRLLEEARQGRPVEQSSRAFHETVACMLAEAARKTAERAGLLRVVLSGGCFVNQLLTQRVADLLGLAGCDVYTHRNVPTTDGGLALGQALTAAAQLRRRTECA